MSGGRQTRSNNVGYFAVKRNMHKGIFSIICFLLVGSYSIKAQEVQATVGVGNGEATFSALYGYNWELGKRKQFSIGLGGRFTSYFGKDQHYRTAPAELTSGATGPFVIFKPDIEANIDTFLIESPQVNSLNLFINLRYSFSNRFNAGFNIDAIGFSFGGSKQGTYINGQINTADQAKPTSFNLLLTSDNDLGSLNSEFYLNYKLTEKFGLKVAAQFHFTEYTTDTEVQQDPEPNDRFRRKSLLFAVGIVYSL